MRRNWKSSVIRKSSLDGIFRVHTNDQRVLPRLLAAFSSRQTLITQFDLALLFLYGRELEVLTGIDVGS